MADLSKSDIDNLSKQVAALSKAMGAASGGNKFFNSRETHTSKNQSDDGGQASKDGKTAAKTNQRIEEAKQLSLKSLKTYTKNLDDLADQVQSTEIQHEAFQDVLKKYAEQISKSSTITDAYNNKLADTARSNEGSIFAQQSAIKKLVAKTESFASKLEQSQRVASLFNAAIFRAHEGIEKGTNTYELVGNKLSQASEGLGEQFLKQADMWDDLTNGIKDNLGVEDFAKLREQLGNAGAVLTKNFSGMEGFGIKSAADLSTFKPLDDPNFKHVDDGKQFKQIETALYKSIKELVAQGHMVNGLQKSSGKVAENIDDEDIRIFLKDTKGAALAVAEFAKRTNASTEQIDKVGTKMATSLGKLSLKTEAAITNIGSTLAKHLVSDAALADAGKKLLDGAKQTYDELVSFNIAQVPASFGQVSAMALKMGMSFEETTKFLQANKHTMALYGASGFDSLRGEIGKTFLSFGYNLKQSVEMIGPAIGAALDSGSINNAQDGKELNSYINDSTAAFQKIAGAVNISADEYFKLNSALLKTEGVSTTLLGLSKEQAATYSKSLIAARDEIAARTGNAELAQKIIQEQESAKREKIDDRVADAAKVMMLMQQLGYNPGDAQKTYSTILAGTSATKEDQAALRKLMPDLARRSAEDANMYNETGNIQGGIQKELMHTAFDPQGYIGRMMKSNEEVAMLGKENALKSDKQIEQSSKDARGSATGAVVSSIGNSISAATETGFGKILLGASSGLFALAAQSYLTTLSLGRLGGGFGSVFSIIGNLTKSLGPFISTMGGGIAKAGSGAMSMAGLAEGGALAGALTSMKMYGKGIFSKFSFGGAANAAEEAATLAPNSFAGPWSSKLMPTGPASALNAASKAEALAAGAAPLAEAEIAASTAGKWAGRLGGVAGLGLGGALAGMAGDYATTKGYTKTGAGLNIAGDALTGAAIGSIIPIVGTALGAALGGAYGLYAHGSELLKPPSPVNPDGSPATNPDGTPVQTDVNNQSAQDQNQSASGITNVADTQGLQQLLLIADNTALAAKILQQIMDSGGMRPQINSAPSAPRVTSYDYQTGRKPS